MPEDHHMGRIAAKGGDVSLDPGEGCNLVHQAVVARRTAAFGCQQWVHKETQHSQPVLDGHHDHTLRRQRRSVKERRPLSTALPVTASMDKNHHRLLLTMWSLGGQEDVQKQAVFHPDGLIVAIELWADISECGGIPRSCPQEWRLRRLPAQVAYGWRSVGDTTEDKFTAGDYTLQCTGLCLRDRAL